MTGFFVLVILGVIAGVLIVTSGLLEARQDLFMRAASAQDLTSDTRVLLQGLEIGRVRQVNATMDSSSGRLAFVARLTIMERFPDGAAVTIPRGTRAVIEQVNPIAAPVVQLLVPGEGGRLGYLEPGDTIGSERRAGAVDALGRIASDLSEELRSTLDETRATLLRTRRAATETERLLVASTPRVSDVLERIAANLTRTEAMLADVGPRMGPLQDSLMAVLAETRQVLRRVDQLATSAHSVVGDNQTAIRETVQHLHNSAVLLEHFATQISRRPTRLLTGVRPPPADTGSR